MIAVESLFEAHLTVSDIERAKDFYGGSLGLQLAHWLPERKVAFYWLGGEGNSMLCLWEVGSAPNRMSLHLAFRTDLASLFDSPRRLHEAKITPLDFWLNPSDEPTVLAWMPAASIYFHDPDGNLLEFLAMLPETARPESGVVRWGEWQRGQASR